MALVGPEPDSAAKGLRRRLLDPGSIPWATACWLTELAGCVRPTATSGALPPPAAASWSSRRLVDSLGEESVKGEFLASCRRSRMRHGLREQGIICVA